MKVIDGYYFAVSLSLSLFLSLSLSWLFQFTAAQFGAKLFINAD